MSSLDSLKVVAFSRERIPNENPGGQLPWQRYHTVRNAIVQTCRKYGPTGPMGVLNLEADAPDLYEMLAENRDAWERGDSDPWYFIVDDQYNHERYCYAELSGNEPFNNGWLLSITEALRQFEGWGLVITNIPDSSLLIFGKRLMVKGQLARCQTASEVIRMATRLLKQGPKRWWQFWK